MKFVWLPSQTEFGFLNRLFKVRSSHHQKSSGGSKSCLHRSQHRAPLSHILRRQLPRIRQQLSLRRRARQLQPQLSHRRVRRQRRLEMIALWPNSFSCWMITSLLWVMPESKCDLMLIYVIIDPKWGHRLLPATGWFRVWRPPTVGLQYIILICILPSVYTQKTPTILGGTKIRFRHCCRCIPTRSYTHKCNWRSCQRKSSPRSRCLTGIWSFISTSCWFLIPTLGQNANDINHGWFGGRSFRVRYQRSQARVLHVNKTVTSICTFYISTRILHWLQSGLT